MSTIFNPIISSNLNVGSFINNLSKRPYRSKAPPFCSGGINERHIKPGIVFTNKFTISATKTVPALYPESEEFLAIPEVFATGYTVGLIERTYIKAINPYLDWPREQTIGIHINVSHIAATPAGLEVTTKVKLIGVYDRKLLFEVKAHDGIDLITRGEHDRFIICKDKFDKK